MVLAFSPRVPATKLTPENKKTAGLRRFFRVEPCIRRGLPGLWSLAAEVLGQEVDQLGHIEHRIVAEQKATVLD